jgi:hypothetical protein
MCATPICSEIMPAPGYSEAPISEARNQRVAYGPTDIEKVDIAWRSGRSADYALYAEVFVPWAIPTPSWAAPRSK